MHSDSNFADINIGLDPNAAVFRELTRYPVVIAHPSTGGPYFYVNSDFTLNLEGWSVEESAPLLVYLYVHATRPEYSCRLNWEEGSVAIWDNRIVQHFACADYVEHAWLMHRITVEDQRRGAF